MPNRPLATSLQTLASLKRQRVQTTSAEQYAREVATHAKIEPEQSLYSGYTFSRFADWLTNPGDFEVPIDESNYPFVTLHDLSLDDHDINRIKKLRSITQLEEICQEKKKTENPSLLVFLNGNPSAGWIRHIGYLCEVDPEFFLRHMDFRFLSDLHYFALPALPSSSSNIIRLHLTSIGVRSDIKGYSQKEIERMRVEAMDNMSKYLETAKAGRLSLGDSIVRSFAIHDQENYSLEQDISICVNKFGKGWLGVIWLDSANDLSHGRNSDGPWCSKQFRANTWNTSINPTILHKPNIALENNYIKTEPIESRSFPQVACSLHDHYGRFLDPDVRVKEPFFALSELFAFAASTEVQFLNMMEAKIAAETDSALRTEYSTEPDASKYSANLSNLLYNKNILEKHIRRLKENIFSIRTRGGPTWTHATDEKCAEKVNIVAKSLLDDYQYLLEMATLLSESCDKGMVIAGSNADVMESKAAARREKLVSKLTLLGFVYIPGSFTASIFGMNFVQFGTGTLNIWVWFLLLIPVYIVSLLVLYADLPMIANKASKRFSHR